MEKGKAIYLGTEINEEWWKKYSKEGFFLTGKGAYWYDNAGFYLLRHLTKKPLFIPYRRMIDIKTGETHQGKWVWGYPILKILWTNDDFVKLSSGFFITKDPELLFKLVKTLKSRIPEDNG